MKNLFILLLTLLIAACSENNNKEAEPTQDYTSFVLQMDEPVDALKSAYLDKTNGHYRLIADHDILEPQEIVLTVEIDPIHIFFECSTWRKLALAFAIKKNAKNTITPFGSGRRVIGVPMPFANDSTLFPLY